MVDYGITKNGFVQKPYSVIRQEIIDEIEGATGCKINDGTDSVIGTLVSVFASREAQNWQLLQEIYYSGFPATANSGKSLANAVTLAGITSKPATYTTINMTLHVAGSNYAELKEGWTVSDSKSKDIFELPADKTISTASCYTIEFSMAYANAKYYLAIGTKYAKTVDNTSGKYGNLATIIGELIARADIPYPIATNTVFSKDGKTATLKIEELNGLFVDSQINGEENPYMAISWFETKVSFRRKDLSDTSQVELLEINKINDDNMKKKVESVRNEEFANIGSPVETDASLRKRWALSMSTPSGFAGKNNIKHNLENFCDGVSYAMVYENNTDGYDDLGLKPHSIMAVVEGGDDDEIASVIYRATCAGIEYNGNITKLVKDDFGNNHEIQFVRPSAKDVYVDLVLIRENDYMQNGWNEDSVSDAKKAVKTYFSGMRCNQSVSGRRIERAVINAVPAVIDAIASLSFESTDDARENGKHAISGERTTKYVLKGVSVYVISEKNT